MTLLPLRFTRLLQPLLLALRSLSARGWLREADVDACLGAVQPAWALNRIHARVLSRRWVAEDMLAIRLRPNANWPGARAGQHVQLQVERDGVRLSRSYSLTAVTKDWLEIAVRPQAGGRVSSWLCEQLGQGDCVELGQPFGELCWPTQGPVLLLAAGSGLTPLLGLLGEALQNGYQAPVRLLHYVSRYGQRAFVEELLALQAAHANFSVAWSITGELVTDALSGRFQLDHVPTWQSADVLICGPAGFVETVRGSLGATANSLQWESFTPPQWAQAGERREVSLSFSLSQVQGAGDNQRSLLEQAEALGLRPAYGCRQGICVSCTCQLVEGAVRDLRSGEVSHEPGQAIRLCVSAPMGDVRINL